ncbi:MAG: anion transporter [Betaproteobacteria bacterium RIFCSPLOWO2_12_FULL_65_14]|nr:MAG: anion transporter [Betaproteobacteria bacterium RIFCSPLOWO2_12_FULL_65_14]
MTATVVTVFVIVYAGMILGGLPFLQLDRTGVALLGAIAIVGLGALTPEQAALSIHLPTLLLLFSFMVISAQMRLGGFYTWVTLRIAELPVAPPALLAATMAAAAALSAVFSNDVVCLAIAPVLADACLKRGLDPMPYLLGLACAANVGSAATLIGNPQNMLIGEVLRLSFAAYLGTALVPVLAGLATAWAIIAWQARGRWAGGVTGLPAPERRERATAGLDRWQTAKGLAVAGALVVIFVFTSWPREVAALIGAGILMMSRRLHSNKMLGLVDWELLILFIGLFVVNHALARTGVTADAVRALASAGLPLAEPAPLFAATFVLSNVVSNVPAVMLLLPAASEPFSGPMLALVSTLAGNLLIVGSIANIIVVGAARRHGIAIDWRRHARTGIPVTLATLGLTAAWFALVA